MSANHFYQQSFYSQTNIQPRPTIEVYNCIADNIIDCPTGIFNNVQIINQIQPLSSSTGTVGTSSNPFSNGYFLNLNMTGGSGLNLNNLIATNETVNNITGTYANIANLTGTNASITFQTSGGTGTNLNYFEEYVQSFTGSGCWTTANQQNIGFVRIGGHAIQCNMYNVSNGGANNAIVSYTGQTIPARFTPTFTQNGFVVVTNGNSNTTTLGLCTIKTDGTLQVGFDANQTGANPSAQTVAIRASSFLYNLN